MKKQAFLKMTAVLAFFFFAQAQTKAQGDFYFTNTTANPLWVELFADYDDCAGAYLCSTGLQMVAAATTYTFNTPCTANGAWKYMCVTDFCGKTTVGYCGYSGSGMFTDCGSNIVTATWYDEHNGDAN